MMEGLIDMVGRMRPAAWLGHKLAKPKKKKSAKTKKSKARKSKHKK